MLRPSPTTWDIYILLGWLDLGQSPSSTTWEIKKKIIKIVSWSLLGLYYDSVGWSIIGIDKAEFGYFLSKIFNKGMSYIGLYLVFFLETIVDVISGLYY